jgi:hypothetical protein
MNKNYSTIILNKGGSLIRIKNISDIEILPEISLWGCDFANNFFIKRNCIFINFI